MKDFLRSTLFVALCLCVFAVGGFGQGDSRAGSPRSVAPAGMDAAKLGEIDGVIQKAIADKNFPGAVVIVGHRGKVVYRKAFGNRSLVPTVEPMTKGSRTATDASARSVRAP